MTNILSAILFGEGLLTGLTLTLMLGPVTMIILRNGIQVDRGAGVSAAVGTWVSDYIFIAFTFWLTSYVEEWTQKPDVRLGLYLVGGLGLLIMGLLMLRHKKKSMDENMEGVQANYFHAFMGGFLVNSLSPFTLFFWLGAAMFLHVQSDNPFWYYAGLMLALSCGDFTKAWMAPKLTVWLKENYVYWIQMGAGVVIAATGVYIIVLGYLET
jgi:threonine/homoserine/homoserine lactone efflux protein